MTQAHTTGPVAADPYAWPFDGDLRPENTALVIIDMQTDFCGKGGVIRRRLFDRAPLRRAQAARVIGEQGVFIRPLR